MTMHNRDKTAFAHRLLVGILSACCILLYQNCGADFAPGEMDLNSLGPFTCGNTEAETFAKTFHPFVVKNCVSCHGSIQAPKFALSDPGAAFEQFQQTTLVNFENYALNPSHGGGAGGPKNQAAIDTIFANYESCKSNSGDPGEDAHTITARTQPLLLNATSSLVVKTYTDLNSQMLIGGGVLNGAKLDFQVRIDTDASPPLYVIARPRLQTGATALQIRAMYIMINGVRIPHATAFIGLDAIVPANTALASGTLAPGAATFEYPTFNTASDTIQFEFEVLAPAP